MVGAQGSVNGNGIAIVMRSATLMPFDGPEELPEKLSKQQTTKFGEQARTLGQQRMVLWESR